MSSEDGGFNPVSYHNGSVWPHDNAITAAGLARYGFRDQAADIAVAIFEAAERFEEHRLPEVYTGYSRSESSFPVWYPKASCPQGWAAAAPLLLVRTLAGLEFSHGQARADPPAEDARPFRVRPGRQRLAGPAGLTVTSLRQFGSTPGVRSWSTSRQGGGCVRGARSSTCPRLWYGWHRRL